MHLKLLLLLLIITYNGDGKKVYQVYLNDLCRLTLSLGDPPQIFTSALNFGTPDLLVVDSTCGIKIPNCFRYCEDEVFRQIFCSPLCENFNPATEILHCNVNYESRYFKNKSNTFKEDGIKWTGQMYETRLMKGIMGRETIRLYDNIRRDVYLPMVSVKNVRFVRGIDMHRSLFMGSEVVLGMAPSNKNLIMQAYLNDELEKPVISISGKRFGESRTTDFIQIGAIDEKNCQHWKKIKSVSSNEWIIKADSVEAGPVKMTENNRIEFHVGLYKAVLAPREFIQQLIQNGMLIESSEANVFYTNKTAKYDLKLKFGEREIIFSGSYLNCRYTDDRKNMISCLKISDLIRYEESPRWVFGKGILYQWCLSLDYANLEVGIGDKVKL